VALTTDMSMQKPPDARDLRYLKLVNGRQQGLDEEKIAKLAGEGSPTLLYERIREDGHPICPRCGTTYVDERHCKVAPTEKKGGGRKARSSGPAKQLPPARDAAPLFRETLEQLLQATEELKHRDEKLQGGRFFQSSVHADPVYFPGDLMSDEQWQYARESLGIDPEAKDYMYFGGATWTLGGGSAAPDDPLPALIGTYLLAGGQVEPLVELLHHDAASAEWKQIEKRIAGRKSADGLDGLRTLARQLATLMLGGELGPGRDPTEVSGIEYSVASRISELRKQGWSHEDAYRKVRSLNNSFARELSWEDYQRLADLQTEYPWPRKRI
jgi:hypothetical protein